MAIFLLWLITITIGGLLVQRAKHVAYIPALMMIEPHQEKQEPRAKGVR